MCALRSAAGSFVQTPCGPRKSGMPDSVEMPAPVSTTIWRASRSCAARRSSWSASSVMPGRFRCGVAASGHACAASPSHRVDSASASRPPATPALHLRHVRTLRVRAEDEHGTSIESVADADSRTTATRPAVRRTIETACVAASVAVLTIAQVFRQTGPLVGHRVGGGRQVLLQRHEAVGDLFFHQQAGDLQLTGRLFGLGARVVGVVVVIVVWFAVTSVGGFRGTTPRSQGPGWKTSVLQGRQACRDGAEQVELQVVPYPYNITVSSRICSDRAERIATYIRHQSPYV